ncbi:hypothetical protein A2716_05035 [candidate division WWE3 bacterium RIFCSPHIGHO2_01_FULL_40_23]|uniref:Uncharacterized protein n=1 Tax=candidate division WWE3 bacterium RIFCSPLOWO2_01_FULL_41_18 TaxID=1802625 RepID=A0A1F4VDI6_UNCKA|nr:MAG: hypothetical protein A2716_05035 [candidate division WWE3 bacterium RIFCSPHIGHO2_01_FULL_40_23]OGC55235.1 MAG: hypothetical protein A3A78_04645 [candidate division WWE3 bacterium RIFCSPLOWO2_01_FULL_41_18]
MKRTSFDRDLLGPVLLGVLMFFAGVLVARSFSDYRPIAYVLGAIGIWASQNSGKAARFISKIFLWGAILPTFTLNYVEYKPGFTLSVANAVVMTLAGIHFFLPLRFAFPFRKK